MIIPIAAAFRISLYIVFQTMKTALLFPIVVLTARSIIAAPGPINGRLLYGYSYVGCYSDTRISNSTYIPFLGYRQAWSANYTIENCISICSNNSRAYAGLRNGIEVSYVLSGLSKGNIC